MNLQSVIQSAGKHLHHTGPDHNDCFQITIMVFQISQRTRQIYSRFIKCALSPITERKIATGLSHTLNLAQPFKDLYASGDQVLS